MKAQQICCLLLLACLIQAETLPDKQIQCMDLNNEGISALNQKDFAVAFDRFRAALKVDPDYSLARDNLIVTHGQYGRQLRAENHLSKALQEFHKAAYRGPYWEDDVSITVHLLGKDPRSVADRVELGDKAVSEKDYIGAVVEYRCALQLQHPNTQVQSKFDEASRLIGITDE